MIFHLAAAVSGECEADFDLGIRANLRATEALLAPPRAGDQPARGVLQLARRLRRHRRPPAAGCGQRPDHAQPADQLRRAEGHRRAAPSRLHQEGVPARPRPAPGEHQRAPRAPERRGVRLHVGRHQGAAGGQRATCPVAPDTEVALASPAKAIAGLRCAAAASDQAWGGRSAVNLPALTVSLADMADSLARIAGPQVERANPGPGPGGSPHGRQLARPGPRQPGDPTRPGPRDPDFDSIVRMHLAESHSGADSDR